MPPPPIRVEGLASLSRAFALADKTVKNELVGELKIAGIPVASKAERLAHGTIPGIGRPRPKSWGNMRVGFSRHTVYVVPRQRGLKGSSPRKRQNIKALLLDRAMEPALEQEASNVEARVNFLLTRVARQWGRVG